MQQDAAAADLDVFDYVVTSCELFSHEQADAVPEPDASQLIGAMPSLDWEEVASTDADRPDSFAASMAQQAAWIMANMQREAADERCSPARRHALLYERDSIWALVPADWHALCEAWLAAYSDFLSGGEPRPGECGVGGVPDALVKYWRQRHALFRRYDDGVVLDAESWFSVTPEPIAAHIAMRLADMLAEQRSAGAELPCVLDAFCGAGGNAVAFAAGGRLRVLACDVDPAKIACACNNAAVYAVRPAVQFVCADYFRLAARLARAPGAVQAVFLAPPWGGPDYAHSEEFDVRAMGGLDAHQIVLSAACLADIVAVYLPRNTAAPAIAQLARALAVRRGAHVAVECEEQYLDGRLKAITVYLRLCPEPAR